MRGKLIVVEGTDCSGKETQTNLLLERLLADGVKVQKFSYPNYESPTGKIVGGPYLGKQHICEGWFSEGAAAVDSKIAALYYAADRKYNIGSIIKLLDDGINIILDRYIYSNMAHQGGKIETKEDRINMYKWIESLEFNLLELPEADIKVFLHMPYEQAIILKKNRTEKPDQLESDEKHLKMAELSFVEISSLYNFKSIECNDNDRIKTIQEINEELYIFAKEKLS